LHSRYKETWRKVVGERIEKEIEGYRRKKQIKEVINKQ
jgi:hypothetical protein